MKLSRLVVGGAALGAAWYLSSRMSRIERRVHPEAVEGPAVARAYEWVAGLPQLRVMQEMVAIRAVEKTAQERALDLGSGPGGLAIALALRAPRLAVIGADLSDTMIDLASSNARKAGVADRVTFVKAPAEQLPYPDASFDVVVSSLSLHHWSDPVAVFDEVARLLRPGGRFLLFDLRRDLGLLPLAILWFATHVVVPPALRRVNEPMSSREAAYTPQELVDILSRSTLQNWKGTTGPFWLTIESAS